MFQDRFAGVDIRVRVNGGGHVSQIYAIRQAISKALVAYYQKCKCYFQFLLSFCFIHDEPLYPEYESSLNSKYALISSV